jgi:hypothetical protein
VFRSRPSFLPLEQGSVTEVAHLYEIVIIQMVIISFWSDDLIQNDCPIPGPVVCYQGRAKSIPKLFIDALRKRSYVVDSLQCCKRSSGVLTYTTALASGDAASSVRSSPADPSETGS